MFRIKYYFNNKFSNNYIKFLMEDNVITKNNLIM